MESNCGNCAKFKAATIGLPKAMGLGLCDGMSKIAITKSGRGWTLIVSAQRPCYCAPSKWVGK